MVDYLVLYVLAAIFTAFLLPVAALSTAAYIYWKAKTPLVKKWFLINFALSLSLVISPLVSSLVGVIAFLILPFFFLFAWGASIVTAIVGKMTSKKNQENKTIERMAIITIILDVIWPIMAVIVLFTIVGGI